jgi:hypothetical protein
VHIHDRPLVKEPQVWEKRPILRGAAPLGKRDPFTSLPGPVASGLPDSVPNHDCDDYQHNGHSAHYCNVVLPSEPSPPIIRPGDPTVCGKHKDAQNDVAESKHGAGPLREFSAGSLSWHGINPESEVRAHVSEIDVLYRLPRTHRSRDAEPDGVGGPSHLGEGPILAGVRRRATMASQTAPMEPINTPRSTKDGPGQTKSEHGPGVHIPLTHGELQCD